MDLPKEILIEIFENFGFKELIRLTGVSIVFRQFIQKTAWDHITVTFFGYYPNIMQFYNFKNYNICALDFTDDQVNFLAKCRELDLSSCNQITDASVKLLGGCHTLNLRCCYQITDASVKLLCSW